MEPRDVNAANYSVRDLLAQQLLSIEKILAFNQAVSERYDNDFNNVPRSLEADISKASMPCQRQHEDASHLAHSLTQPLLPSPCTSLQPLVVQTKAASYLQQASWAHKVRQDADARRERTGSSSEEKVRSPGSHHSGIFLERDLSSRRLIKPHLKVDHGQKAAAHNMLSTADIKRRITRSLNTDNRASQDIYKKSGWCSRLARSEMFQSATFAAIALNAIWMAYDIDMNKADVLCQAPILFQVVDNAFCIFFSLEILVRYLAFENKLEASSQSIFILDVLLVSLMIWDTWIQVFVFLVAGNTVGGKARILTVLRVFRILRIVRVARVVNYLPELKILLKGMAIAMRSVATIVGLLLLLVYIFAILFTELLSDSSLGWFATVPEAMNFLLLQTLAGADASVINRLLAEGWCYYALYLSFVFVGSLTIMNMLIGVLCSVVTAVAQVEDETVFREDAMHHIGGCLKEIDADGNNTISIDEFELLIDHPEVVQNLVKYGVDVVAFCEFTYFTFQSEREIAMDEFLELVNQFRGTKVATVKDLVDMRKFVTMQLAHPHMAPIRTEILSP